MNESNQSAYSIRKHTLEWRREHVTLRGIVTMPVTDHSVPAIIFGHGFTGHKAEANFMFKRLSDELAKRGYATVRFDFAGSGESDGEFVDMTVSTEVQDMLAVWDAVQVMEGINPKRVSLLGFSLGGVVSLLAAEQLGDELDRLMLLCPALGFQDILARDLQGEKLHHLLQHGCVELYGQKIGQGLFDDRAALRILDAAAQIHTPALIIHGTNDSVVPPYTTYRLHHFLSGSRLRWIDGADHVFGQSVHAVQLLEELIDFLQLETS
ncbi:alpha/beta hydrolase family protein [Paenibacillus agilis]|uniref:Alpha/beta fold hydrolase n=1 Tax=Paenibacillus agilis TaxID=3020863 RepID=A0A559IWC1_9BACL|nr:alpha/beta fold hydrolase [Paenibacillus agilis]TVX91932.1 alpha/beta fold hydrolase [Paenibacillus agilis]